MIPTHTSAGRLPAGTHAATWIEVVERFGWNGRRARMLALLHDALLHLAQAGCRRIFLAGSFVTMKPSPKDVDVCWDVTDVKVEALHPMFLDFYEGRAATLALFGAEFFPTTLIEGESQLTMLDFFQRTRAHEPVGIIALDLETL